MKDLKTCLMFAGFVFFNVIAFAQTKYVRHAKLTEYHSKTQKCVYNSFHENIKDNSATIKLNLEQAGKNLQIAIDKHNELKSKMPEKYRSITKPHHDAIDKYHEEALRHYEAMKSESNNRLINGKLIRQHAEHMYSAINKAEMEHQAIKFKTS